MYQSVLDFKLQKRGLRVAQEVGLPVHYEGIKLELGFRVDLIVGDKVIIEIKSVETLAPVHKKQLLTYLRLMDLRLGLLINFNVELIKDGIQESLIDWRNERISHAKAQRCKGRSSILSAFFAALRLCVRPV